MTDPYKMPPLQSPFVDTDGKITQPWAGLLRDYLVALKAERAPGRVQPFWLSAADVADATKFVQAGADEGKGVNDYLGWAKCDGNDGRPTADEVFLRWGLAGHDAAGAAGGSDSSAHTHAEGTLAAHAAIYGDGTLYHEATGHDFTATRTIALAVPVAAVNSVNFATRITGDTGAASVTDNRPAFYSWVPLVRI